MVSLLGILSALALVGSIGWVVVEPGFEPALAVVASVSGLISAAVVEGRKRQRVRQQQKVSGKSTAYQSGGDINIGARGGDDNAK